MEDETSMFLILGLVAAAVVFFLWKKGKDKPNAGTPDIPVTGAPPLEGPVTRGMGVVPPVPVPVTPISPSVAALLSERPAAVPVTTVGGVPRTVVPQVQIGAPRPLLAPRVPVTINTWGTR
jgi:hypothetical protein